MLGNALGGVRKSIGGLLEKPREGFGKTSGEFLKNLGRIFEKPRDFFIFAYCTKI